MLYVYYFYPVFLKAKYFIMKKLGSISLLLLFFNQGFGQNNGEVITYDNSGSAPFKIVAQYKDGKKDGVCISYYTISGNLKDSGNYINDKKEGLWVDGTLGFKTIVTYIDDKREGLCSTYINNTFSDAHGNLFEAGNYVNGKKVGTWKIFYADNGYEIGEFVEGKKEGEWKSEANWVDWSLREATLASGPFLRVTSISNYRKDTLINKKSVLVNGTLYRESFQEGKNWIEKDYTKEGKLESENITEVGTKKLIRNRYYTNGNLSSSEFLIDYKRYGTWKTFYENGQLKEEENYNNDIRVGTWRYFYQNGKLKDVFSYNAKGELSGLKKQYFENGNLYEIGNYKNGYKTGIWKKYYENGKLEEEGMIVVNDNIGEVKQGLWKVYYENGRLKETGNYFADNKTGAWTYYWENGRLWGTGSYNKYGYKIGIWKYYSEDGKLLK